MKVDPRVERHYRNAVQALRFRALSWRLDVNLLVGGDGSPQRDLRPLAAKVVKLAQDMGKLPPDKTYRRVTALVNSALDWASAPKAVKGMPKWAQPR